MSFKKDHKLLFYFLLSFSAILIFWLFEDNVSQSNQQINKAESKSSLIETLPQTLSQQKTEIHPADKIVEGKYFGNIKKSDVSIKLDKDLSREFIGSLSIFEVLLMISVLLFVLIKFSFVLTKWSNDTDRR